ncbi:MAG: DNA polymerase ligase N-terminal domain-containing protein [Promethearchaeota archaeon]
MGKEYAPGLPQRGKFSKIPEQALTYWSFTLHEHWATKRHFDLRLCDGQKAYSWVLPQGFPDVGSYKRVDAIRQGDHTPEYMTFEGEITEGYGKGKVKIADYSPKMAIIHVGNNPQTIKFALLHHSNALEFVLVDVSNGGIYWKLQEITPKYDDLGLFKDKYKEKRPDSIDAYLGENWAFSRKIDGAHACFDFDKRIIHIYSVRKSKVIVEAMQYTYHSPLQIVAPIPELEKTRIHGEWFLVDETGKSVSVNKISGILNSKPLKALQTIVNEGLQVRFYMFDVEKFKGKNVQKAIWAEKIDMLKQINELTPSWFMFPEYFYSPEDKRYLLNLLESGKDPLTSEGVVAINIDTNETPVKIKFRPEFDVYIREIVGTVKGGKKTAGYFTWSWTPDGEIKGHVGTGLSDEVRDDMFKHPRKYIGRVAVVRAMSKTDSGALRAPALVRFHTDK